MFSNIDANVINKWMLMPICRCRDFRMMVLIINVYRVLLASYVIIVFIIITKCLRCFSCLIKSNSLPNPLCAYYYIMISLKLQNASGIWAVIFKGHIGKDVDSGCLESGCVDFGCLDSGPFWPWTLRLFDG